MSLNNNLFRTFASMVKNKTGLKFYDVTTQLSNFGIEFILSAKVSSSAYFPGKDEDDLDCEVNTD